MRWPTFMKSSTMTKTNAVAKLSRKGRDIKPRPNGLLCSSGCRCRCVKTRKKSLSFTAMFNQPSSTHFFMFPFVHFSIFFPIQFMETSIFPVGNQSHKVIQLSASNGSSPSETIFREQSVRLVQPSTSICITRPDTRSVSGRLRVGIAMPTRIAMHW